MARNADPAPGCGKGRSPGAGRPDKIFGLRLRPQELRANPDTAEIAGTSSIEVRTLSGFSREIPVQVLRIYGLSPLSPQSPLSPECF